MSGELQVNLTVPQSEFLEATEEYVAAVAGFGSGKTDGALIKILNSMFQYPTMDFAYLAPSYSLIRDIFYPKISELLNKLGVQFLIHKNDNIVYVGGCGKIYCRTMQSPDTIVGWECGDAFMDEFDILGTEKARAVMNKVSARCRQKFPDGKTNQKFVTTTPEGFKATYEFFKKKPLEDSRLIQMSTYSNAHNLPKGYIKGLEAQYGDSPLLDAYLGGKFVNLTSGTVYYAFDRKHHHTDEYMRPKEPLHIGMDFNVYHMAGIVHVVRQQQPIAVDEFIDLRDTPQMIEAINEKFPEHGITIYPDASGNSKSSKGASLSDIKLLKDAGFTIKAPNKNPLIKDRVQSMNALFDSGGYRINTTNCPEYTNSVEQQAYDKSGMPEKGNNIDHAPDAGGYFGHYKYPINTRKMFVQSIAL